MPVFDGSINFIGCKVRLHDYFKHTLFLDQCFQTAFLGCRRLCPQQKLQPPNTASNNEPASIILNPFTLCLIMFLPRCWFLINSSLYFPSYFLEFYLTYAISDAILNNYSALDISRFWVFSIRIDDSVLYPLDPVPLLFTFIVFDLV